MSFSVIFRYLVFKNLRFILSFLSTSFRVIRAMLSLFVSGFFSISVSRFTMAKSLRYRFSVSLFRRR